jgi:hypothetical protein
VSKAFNDLKIDESRLGNATNYSIFEAVMTPIRVLTFNSHINFDQQSDRGAMWQLNVKQVQLSLFRCGQT